MEYSLSTVNGQSVYTALPRRPKRNNQAALLIAAVVLLIYGPLKIPFVHKKTRAIGAVDSHTYGVRGCMMHGCHCPLPWS
eukprot:m.37782 g.37782  ORF g.37782 m.37782 type:complete len:80 (+) comp5579_c0_seq1:273-512(+)